MSSIEPNIVPAGRYSISETCKALNIHRNSQYTESGLIKCGFRKGTAQKFYAGSDILKFWRAQL